jgi:TolB protein
MQQVTHGSTPHAAPRWTRDGLLLYTTTAGGDASIFSVRPDGTDEKLVVTVPGRSPELSPDGRRVIYATGPWRESNLFVANLDGSERRQLLAGAVAWNPKWSPDSKRIAFTGSAGDQLQVFVMNADGTEKRQVTSFTKDQGNAQVPAWSSDGRRLAFQANGPGPGTSDIWILDLESKAVRKIAAHDQVYLNETPCWFPDGRRLAFQSNRTGRMEIWTMNADATGLLQITPDH